MSQEKVCFHHKSVDRLSLLLCALTIFSTTAALNAKGRHQEPPAPQDQIEVVGHLALHGGGPITDFLATRHYRRQYLYAQGEGGDSVALIDVTNVANPTLVQNVTPVSGRASLVAAAGTAALVSDGGASDTAAMHTQTFRIMSFADPERPAVQQEFDRVSAVGRDTRRNLIYLANPQGIWILREKPAEDPEAEKEWEHMMLDNR